MNEYKIPLRMDFEAKHLQHIPPVEQYFVRRPYISLRGITPEIGEIQFESPGLAYDFLKPMEKTVKKP